MHSPYPRTAFIPAINGRVFCGIFINFIYEHHELLNLKMTNLLCISFSNN